MLQKYPKKFTFQLFIILQSFTREISQKVAYFLTVSIVFLFKTKTLRLNNLKTRTALNAKISVFVICVEVIMYLLLHNLHDCTFNLDDTYMRSFLKQSKTDVHI